VSQLCAVELDLYKGMVAGMSRARDSSVALLAQV